MRDGTAGFLDFPDNFQSEIFAKIFKSIDRSESVTIIAPPGTGKTLLLQLLSQKRPDAIYLDLNGDWERNIWAQDKSVIILDHAENLTLPDFDKQSLYFKAIREAKRDRVAFVFAISGDVAPAGPLKTVMLENLIHMEPLNKRDATVFLARTEKLYKEKLTPAQKQKILALSGGVPRIIKRLCKLFLDNIDPAIDLKLQSDLDEINKFLQTNPQIKWNIPLLSNSPDNEEVIGKIRFNESLSRQEYELAKLLIERESKLVTREEMIEVVWKSKMYEVNEHALDQMLHRLRKKLDKATPKGKLITYRGRGCKLEVR